MIRFLRKLFGSASDSPDAHLRQGVTFLKEKKCDQAIAAFTEVIRLDPGNASAYRWRAQAHAALGDEAQADADDDKARQLAAPIATEKPMMPVLAKTMSFRTGNYESEAECDQIIREITNAPAWVRDNNPPAFHNRGVAYLQKGQVERAVADFTEAIRLARLPDTCAPLLMRGRAYLCAGKYREAIPDFTQILALEPGNAFVYGCRGTAYNELADYDRAIADCTEALRLAPDLLVAYISRGFGYSKKGEYGQSVADYSQALQLDPANAGLYEDRAKVYRALGDTVRASADEQKAAELRR
jgi:tetratricopeptide (TPR) repeat protein